MSIAQSNLSASQYGFDFVVATTLESLNSTMFEFISSGSIPAVAGYYWEDSTNSTVAVDLDTLMNTAQSRSNPSGTDGVNPATVANWDGTGTAPTGITQLGNSSFMGGFVAQIGIPPGFALPGAPNPNGLPVLDPIVSYNQTGSVVFNLYCSSFQVFQPNWQRGITSYLNQSQPSGEAWFLQTTIPIAQVLNNNNLPPAVQAQLNALGGSEFFSVQQLFLDLDQPSKSTATSVNFGGIQPGTTLQQVLASVFAGDYCAALQTSGAPALGYGIAPTTPSAASSLPLGAVAPEIIPFSPAGDGSNAGLGTFNYLCSQTDTLPSPINIFNWNWFDTQQAASQYSGVVAINRNTLASYLANELAGVVASNCWQPTVSVSSSWPNTYYEFGFGPVTEPSPVIPATGAIILSYNYASTGAGDHGGSKYELDYGSLNMSSSYSLNVLVNPTAAGATSGATSGASITIIQNVVVWAEACWEDTCKSGNFVNKTITDVYSLSVTEDGALVISAPTSTTANNSDTPHANWLTELFTQINDLINWIAKNVSFIGSNMQDIQLNSMQQFVFPGGQAFTYASVDFSENQDLVSYITYANPA